DDSGLIDLPPPALIGHHQFDNAGIAIAAVRHFKLPVSDAQIARGLRTVVWPARIQPLKGKLRDLLPRSSELWLDGAHNAHGAAVQDAGLRPNARVVSGGSRYRAGDVLANNGTPPE